MAQQKSLHEVLTDAFPRHRTVNGILDVRELASDLDLSHEAVYKWIRADRVPAKRVNDLIALSRPNKKADPRLTLDDLLPFVIG